MEKINARRGFLKGFGLLGAAVGGFVAVQDSFANTPPPSPIGSSADVERDVGPVEDIAHLAPLGRINIHLQANNEPPPKPVTGSGYVMFPITQSSENDNKVTMSVGKDNRLWIQVDGKWRRVALEG